MKRKYNAKSIAELMFKILKQNPQLLAFLFVVIQSFTMVNIDNTELRKRKTGRRTAKVTRVLKTQTKAVA